MTSSLDRLEQCDSIVQTVVDQFITRAEKGRVKYGTTLDRTDLTPTQWIQHSIEELSDMLLYLTKLKVELARREAYSETICGERVF
jgi:hypothetical protein